MHVNGKPHGNRKQNTARCNIMNESYGHNKTEEIQHDRVRFVWIHLCEVQEQAKEIMWRSKKKMVTDIQRQDGGVGLELTSHENTKITTNCWTTINKIDWQLPKKISYSQRQRRRHMEM